MAGLRRLGWQPVIVGRLPVLGRRMVAAGAAALKRLRRRGVPDSQIARTLQHLGVADAGARITANPPADQALLPDAEVLARWYAAMTNEGLRLLDQGIARHPSDIDLILVQGHGFPRWKGGPMHLADRQGLMALRCDLRRFASEGPPGPRRRCLTG